MYKTKIFSGLIMWLLLVALLPAWFLPTPAQAVSSGGISVLPARTKDHPDLRSWFIYEAEGGSEVKDKVEVSNESNKAVTVNVTVLDGAVTGDGGYTLVGSEADNKDLGTWATVSEKEISLPPKSKKIIDLTIKVPENADVGSHPGGVVIWENPKPATSGRGGQIAVISRVAARVYLTVPGEIKRILKITSIRHQWIAGVVHFNLGIKNEGNVQLEPQADLKIRGWLGKLGEQFLTPFGLVLRGGEIEGRVPWNGKQPTFGRYVADFRIHYGEKDFKNEYVKDEYIDVRYVFWVMPWAKIIYWLGGILLLLFIRNIWLWLLIQQRLNTKSKKHTVKKGETLTSIATQYNAHPKAVAKFNLLKWPYELTPGDTLLIPQGRMTKLERLEMGKEWNAYYRTEQRKAILSDVRLVGGLVGRLFGKLRRRRGDVAASEAKPIKPAYFGRQNRSAISLAPAVATEALVAERGDTIYDIAEFAGVSVEEVARLNNLRPPYRLRPGQEVLVPVKSKPKSKTKKASAPKKRKRP